MPVLLLRILLLLASASLPGGLITARVAGTADGDSITAITADNLPLRKGCTG